MIADAPVASPVRPVAQLRSYISLTKPRIMELLLVTTLPGMLLAADGWPRPVTLVTTLLGGACATGAASVVNCIRDRDIDAIMERTRNRPLVTGAITVRAASIFAMSLAAVGLALLLAFTTPLAAGLTAASMLWYAGLYTSLKRSTRHNTVLGAAPGAAPVLIGATAVEGSIPPTAVAFFVVVFCWQMPHFWSLAMKYRDDYQRAGIPMLPVVASAPAVAASCLPWAWTAVAASLVLPLLEPALGLIYTAAAVLSGGWFLAESHALRRRANSPETPLRSMRVFRASIIYLMVLGTALIIDITL